MELLQNKKIVRKIGYVIIAVIIFGTGLYIGSNRSSAFQNIKNTEASNGISQTDFSIFWKAWKLLAENHPNNGSVSDQQKIYGAISGLAGAYGDPYTEFFPPMEAKQFNEQIEGSFGGVGIELGQKDKVLTVIAPLKDTPAFKAGIKSGDKIVTIDKESTAEMSVDEAISKIRGEKGTKVTLGIFSENDTSVRDVELIRATIEVPTLDAALRDDGIYTVSLYEFGATATREFEKAMNEFARSSSDKLIIDLRGNPGGYLDAAVDIASYFLPAGKTVVSEDYGAKTDSDVLYSKGYQVLAKKKVKIVVLIDGGSASASEILAGALSENGVATLMGEKSYGKGSVQEVIPITDDTQIKITVAKWLTPKGISISEKGIMPDIEVKFDPKSKKDTVLEKAVEFLKNN